MEQILHTIKQYIPKRVFTFFSPVYHFLLAVIGALIYHFPGKHIVVIGVTGTKGKTTTSELLAEFLDEAGIKTALAGTLRIKYGEESQRNLYKMTMPGRFFVQKFLRTAIKKDCDVAILEMSSQGAVQFRHLFTYPNALIFTNLAPEHIESHGSYEKYRAAKLRLAQAVATSPKTHRALIVNRDDKEAESFLNFPVSKKITYGLEDVQHIEYTDRGMSFVYKGQRLVSHLFGEFNIYNILAAAKTAILFGAKVDDIRRALERIELIAGRAQKITLPFTHPLKSEQNFDVVVDYAHTPDSLTKIYQAFEHKKKICVLGNCGGGRDRWKREEMAAIADTFCSRIILTNEDPYDEDPKAILCEMEKGIRITPYEKILDRRKAIAQALKYAEKDSAVIITGKGTDPYIMGPNDTKTPWSDAEVATEELEKRLDSTHHARTS